MKKKILLIVVPLLLVCLTGFNISQNYKQLKTRKEIIKSEKLMEDSFLIAYFSDLYYGNNNDTKRIEKIVSELNAYNPDLILFGGDLIDSNDLSAEQIAQFTELFSSLKPYYGKYAVLGDNDLLTIENRNLVTKLLIESGFEIIDNTSKIIALDISSRINIVGLGNELNGNRNNDAFSGVDSSYYTFVLSHCPDTFYELSEYSFDYMLSGHSLGGKLRIPLISWFLSKEGAKHRYHGITKDNSKVLDITNGSGTPGSSYRLLADPEIVFYSLRGE